MKHLYFIIILFFLLLISPKGISAQPSELDNPVRPYKDSGEGYGVNTGDKTSDEIFQDLLNIFFGSRPKDKSTGSQNSNSTTNPTGTFPPNPDDEDSNNPQPTNVVKTPKPGYTPNIAANSGEAQFADEVTAAFKNYCGGIVTISNYACVDKVSQLGIDSIKQLKSDMNAVFSKYAIKYLQCVNCVRVMSTSRGRPYTLRGDAKSHIPPGNGTVRTNASNYTYYSNTPNNYQYLIPGTIGINTKGIAGHIYYITEVYRDSNGTPTDFKAFECNYGPSGSVRHDVIRKVSSSELVGWQKPNNL